MGFPREQPPARGTAPCQAPKGPGSPAAHRCQDGSCFPAMPGVLRHEGSSHGLTKTGREQPTRHGASRQQAESEMQKPGEPFPRQHCWVPSTLLLLQANVEPAPCSCTAAPQNPASGNWRSWIRASPLPRHPTSSCQKRCRVGMEESCGHLPALDVLSPAVPLQREVILQGDKPGAKPN